MKNLFLPTIAIIATIGLCACENVRADINAGLDGMRRDFGIAQSAPHPYPPERQPEATAMAASSPTTVASVASTPALSAPSPLSRLEAETQSASALQDCPDVRIVADLNQIHQFTQPEKPSPQGSISSIWMRDVQNHCSTVKDNVAIDITLAFEGIVGPKGKRHPGDHPSFSYPYFIAITGNDGSIIAKEVFAVTFSYDDAKTMTKIEKIRQIVPAGAKTYRDYKILVGFQLNDQELAFNRTQSLPEIEPAAGIP